MWSSPPVAGDSPPMAPQGCARQIGADGEPVVLPGDAPGGPAQSPHIGEIAQVAVGQGDIRHLDGNLRAASARGDADVRLGQCQRVVHAVADHNQCPALPAQLVQQARPFLRQQSRMAGIQSKLPTQGLGDRRFVAGDQDDPPDPGGAQALERRSSPRAQSTPDPYAPQQTPVPGDVNRGLSLLDHPPGIPDVWRNIDAGVDHHPAVTEYDVAVVEACLDALSQDVLAPIRRFRLDAERPGPGEYAFSRYQALHHERVRAYLRYLGANSRSIRMPRASQDCTGNNELQPAPPTGDLIMNSYRIILCATDFSPFSDRACVRATKLATESGATLTLLHVVDHFPVDRSNAEIAPEDVDPKLFRERKAREELEAQTVRTGCTEAQREVVFSTHAAAHEIVRYADANGADLIVVGSHGHKGIGELLGSTAKAVHRHAACEVIVVPAEEDQGAP